MSIAGTTHFEIRADATAANVNGGGFNPANANFMTDLTTDANTANTSAPICSSATYNFVAGDVGAYLFIKSGTDWTPGWYVIASVAANKATLNAAVGAATLYTSRQLNTAVGCATVGTPTGGVFSVDSTHLTAARENQTDGTAAGTTAFSSATAAFTKAMIGNLLHITAGTGATVGWYEIVNQTDANNITLDRSPGTTSNATFYVSGAMSMNSTLDDEFLDMVTAGGTIWMNAAGGTISIAESVSPANSSSNQNVTVIWGFASVRGDRPTDSTRPLVNCGAFNFAIATGWIVGWVQFTGTFSPVLGNSGGASRQYWFVKVTNTSTTNDVIAVQSPGDITWIGCEVISYRGRGIVTNGRATIHGCWVHGCKNAGIDASGTSSNAVVISKSIISDFVSEGVREADGMLPARIIDCTIFGALNTRGIGITIGAATVSMRYLVGSIISGCATGIDSDGPAPPSIHYDDYNTYYNNDTDVADWVKGPHDNATDPGFTNVGQVVGTAGAFVGGGFTLVDTSKNFTTLGVVVGDLVYISAGTGLAQAMFYGITAISTTTNPNDTLTLDVTPGTNTTADKAYEIETGHNFLPTNSSVLISGFPQEFPGGFTTSAPPIGAVSRETGASSGGRSSVFIG